MSLSFSVADLRTALDAYNTALAAAVGNLPEDATWAAAEAALGAYEAIWSGLPKGTQGELPDPSGPRATLKAALDRVTFLTMMGRM